MKQTSINLALSRLFYNKKNTLYIDSVQNTNNYLTYGKSEYTSGAKLIP